MAGLDYVQFLEDNLYEFQQDEFWMQDTNTTDRITNLNQAFVDWLSRAVAIQEEIKSDITTMVNLVPYEFCCLTERVSCHRLCDHCKYTSRFRKAIVDSTNTVYVLEREIQLLRKIAIALCSAIFKRWTAGLD